MSVICPCRGCGKRHATCHADCEDYNSWKTFRTEAVKKARVEDKASHLLAEGYERRSTGYAFRTKRQLHVGGGKGR